ncbi:MAG: pilus assembly PilX N-terminal domain-containing protein [Actinobacteria bacterium]|nr:pilus assembly PilX N-terminal domain-containing protein [Actinomycetota bacterium]
MKLEMKSAKMEKINWHDEDGVALITVIFLAAILMMMGAGMYFVASREGKMSAADYAGGQAFSYAEGGIENVMNILNYAGTEYQLTRQRADQSPDGFGYLMDPDPTMRQTPTNPIVMSIGNQNYTVSVDEVDQNGNHCAGCGLNLSNISPAYLLITAEGQSSQGYRKLQQRVQLEPSNYPLTFFIDGDVNMNGSPVISDQSIYVRGNFYGREKLTISGTDQIYGGGAGVRSTGSIYAKSNGGNTQIFTSSGGPSSYWASNYVNDRDSRGPTGNTFSAAELNNTFSTSGLTASQLAILKSAAKASGYYNGSASGNITIQQNDLPNRAGDVVIYIEYPSGTPNSNEVDLKFEWPNQPTYTTGKALVVVKNGSVKLTGSAIGDMQGVIYCPDGQARSDGSGNGIFTGYIWSKGLTNIGNFTFKMDTQMVGDPPFFAWTVTRDTTWTEVDR